MQDNISSVQNVAVDTWMLTHVHTGEFICVL